MSVELDRCSKASRKAAAVSRALKARRGELLPAFEDPAPGSQVDRIAGVPELLQRIREHQSKAG